MTPQPRSPAASGRARGSTFVHWPAATSVFSAKAPMPSAGGERRSVGEGHLLAGVVRGEAVPGAPAAARAALPADRPPVQDDEVAGLDAVHAGPDGLHEPCRLVPEQEREVVVDAALAGSAGRCGTRRRPGRRPRPRRARDRGRGSSRSRRACPSPLRRHLGPQLPRFSSIARACPPRRPGVVAAGVRRPPSRGKRSAPGSGGPGPRRSPYRFGAPPGAAPRPCPAARRPID